jgi:hypothetical protein
MRRPRKPTALLANEWRYALRMEPTEIQAKAVIAAALIASHAVEIPRIPATANNAATRLRELTNYVYQAITAD